MAFAASQRLKELKLGVKLMETDVNLNEISLNLIGSETLNHLKLGSSRSCSERYCRMLS